MLKIKEPKEKNIAANEHFVVKKNDIDDNNNLFNGGNYGKQFKNKNNDL